MVKDSIENGIYKKNTQILLYMTLNYFKTSYTITLRIIKILEK